MKNILLVDVDSKIPNLTLMKLSTYYKSLGYNVKLIKLGFSYYPHNKSIEINAENYKFTFVSIIFKINNERIIIKNSEVFFGGVGHDLYKKLPERIEKLNPDYSIYPYNDTSYGFITRGCIRKCKICVVPEKEGLIHKVNSIDNIVKHKKVKFLDNNILAYKNHVCILEELIEKNIKCQFNQGLDIRLLNHVNVNLLSQINYLGEYIFAFDNIKDKCLIEEKLNLFKEYVKNEWKCKFYIYCHPDMNITNDVLNRIKWCKDNKVLPYLMRDISCWDSNNKNFYIDLASWCNQPALFKKLSFKEFMIKRTKNKERQEKSINIFNIKPLEVGE